MFKISFDRKQSAFEYKYLCKYKRKKRRKLNFVLIAVIIKLVQKVSQLKKNNKELY